MKFIWFYITVAALSIFSMAAASSTDSKETNNKIKFTVGILANEKVSLRQIEKEKIRQIFTGTLSEIDGQYIRGIICKDYELHDAFLKEYMNMSWFQFDKYWSTKIHTGRHRGLRTFSVKPRAFRHIQNVRGAVGYASKGVKVDKTIYIFVLGDI